MLHYDGTFNADSATFTDNTASNNGGAVYNDGTFTADSATFTDNTASYEWRRGVQL